MTSKRHLWVLARMRESRVWSGTTSGPLYGRRLGEAGFNAYDIAKLMGHANISTSQLYVRNLPVGAGEAVMLKNQHRHSNPAPTLSAGFGHFEGCGK
jgi:hypothetical protein